MIKRVLARSFFTMSKTKTKIQYMSSNDRRGTHSAKNHVTSRGGSHLCSFKRFVGVLSVCERINNAVRGRWVKREILKTFIWTKIKSN